MNVCTRIIHASYNIHTTYIHIFSYLCIIIIILLPSKMFILILMFSGNGYSTLLITNNSYTYSIPAHLCMYTRYIHTLTYMHSCIPLVRVQLCIYREITEIIILLGWPPPTRFVRPTILLLVCLEQYHRRRATIPQSESFLTLAHHHHHHH